MTIANGDLTREQTQTRDNACSEVTAHKVEQQAPEPTKAGGPDESHPTAASSGKKAGVVVVDAIQKIDRRRAELLEGVGALDSIYVALTTDVVDLVGSMSKAAARRLVEQVRSEDLLLRSADAGPAAALIAVARRGMPRTVKGSLSKCRRIAEEALASGKDVRTLLQENNGHFWSIYDKLPKAPRKSAAQPSTPVIPAISDDVARQLSQGRTAVVTWFDRSSGSLVQSVIALEAALGLLDAAPASEGAEARHRPSGSGEGRQGHQSLDGEDEVPNGDGATEAEVGRGTADSETSMDAPRNPTEQAGEVPLESASAFEHAHNAESENEAEIPAVPQASEAAPPATPADVEETTCSERATEPRRDEEPARKEADVAPAQGALGLAKPAGGKDDLVGRVVHIPLFLGAKKDIMERYARQLPPNGRGSRWRICTVTPELLELVAEMRGNAEPVPTEAS